MLQDPDQTSSLSGLGQPSPDACTNKPLGENKQQDRTNPQLRIDAFLGEWLNKGYFEHGTPPPDSTKLLTDAREVLKKPAEEIKGSEIAPPPTYDFADVDWNEKENEASTPMPEKTGLRAMAAAGHSALPNRMRTISFGTDTSNSARPRSRQRQASIGTYSAPVPTYAMAPSDTIPMGYFAHARDACVAVDWRWDSMIEPHNFGDGGQYDEEWSTMHRRFRNGLQKMLAFYEHPGGEEELLTNPLKSASTADDEDLVLILVTHQAGCNALIRLLTGAPALHDIGTSSLTMAVRKDGLERKQSHGQHSPTRRRGSLDLGVSDDFDMRIVASTEHLRASSAGPNANTPRIGHHRSATFATSRTVGSDSPDGFSLTSDAVPWRHSSVSSGVNRSASLRSHAADTGTNTPSSGLWGSASVTRASSGRAASVSAAGSIPEEIWGSRTDTTTTPATSDILTPSDQDLPIRSASSRIQKGLWGGGASPGSIADTHERGPGKRRWTASIESTSP